MSNYRGWGRRGGGQIPDISGPGMGASGGGGGAPADAEGYIMQPNLMYTFHLARGGLGRSEDGESASISTFGETLLFANGGEGGKAISERIPSLAPGGEGWNGRRDKQQFNHWNWRSWL